MALNKDIYKSPEDKLKAYRAFRDKNCGVCKGCNPVGGQNSAFYIQMCFTAWLESDPKFCFSAATEKKAKKAAPAKKATKRTSRK